MAKSGKQKPSAPAAKTAAVAASSPGRNWLGRPAIIEPNAALLRKIFWGVAAGMLLLLLTLSLRSGVNADDKFQNDYSTKLVNYYGTFGKDTTALYIKDGNMHLYGGFFEIITGFTNKAFGLTPNDWGYHHVRHLWSGFFGWLAILFSGLLAMSIAGWRAGLLTLILMALSPRFVGDSMMNPKDIPFAAGYIMALYGMTRTLDTMPRPAWKHVAVMAGGLCIALATRAGGLLPFAIIGLFTGLHFLLSRNAESKSGLGDYLKYIGVGLVGGYVLAVLFWPYALQSPLKNPLAALSKFADLEVHIRVLFEGENVMSDKTPWYYPIKWMGYTIPLTVLAGFLGAFALGTRLMRRYQPLWMVLLMFAAVFPVFYVIYKNSVIHDGWRHLTFAFPPLAVLAGLFWNELLDMFGEKKTTQYALYGALALSSLEPAWFIASNSAYPYVYFNPAIGGTKGAYGQFETDYWGVSVRQGIEWLEGQGILGPNMQQQVVIATNMAYSAQKLTARYGDKVRIRYIKWEKRCDEGWDYALYPTRFLDGATLQKGLWPPDNAVHIVEAGGAPILAVLKDNGRNCAQGMAKMKTGEWAAAADFLKQETANVPDNDLAWVNLAQAHLNLDQLEEAKAAAEHALNVSPDDAQANNLIGMYWLQKNDLEKAKGQFNISIKKEASNPGAYYYLALIARNQGDLQTAMVNLEKAMKVAPNFKPAYELAAAISEQTGNMSQAQQLRAILQQLK